jgi:NADH-quinone oxidoreductase subunit G
LRGFEYTSAEEVRSEVLGPAGNISDQLGNRLSPPTSGTEAGRNPPAARSGGIERIAEVPIYASDSIVRRSRPLQQTPHAAPPVARMNRALFERLGLREGDGVRLRQDGGAAVVAVAIDDKLPADCIRIATARSETAELGAMFGELEVERVPAQQKVAV